MYDYKTKDLLYNYVNVVQSHATVLQGVVTYAPPVEAFATGIKNFDRRNRPLIA